MAEDSWKEVIGGTAWCGDSGRYISLAIERTRKDKDRKSLKPLSFLMSPCVLTVTMMSHLPAHALGSL